MVNAADDTHMDADELRTQQILPVSTIAQSACICSQTNNRGAVAQDNVHPVKSSCVPDWPVGSLLWRASASISVAGVLDLFRIGGAFPQSPAVGVALRGFLVLLRLADAGRALGVLIRHRPRDAAQARLSACVRFRCRRFAKVPCRQRYSTCHPTEPCSWLRSLTHFADGRDPRTAVDGVIVAAPS